MLNKPDGLFDDLPREFGRTISKGAFAERTGVTPGRVSQMIGDGLPVEPNGKIDPRAAEAWIDENVDPEKRKAWQTRRDGEGDSGPTAKLTRIRAEHETAKMELAKLELARKSGALIDREAARRAVYARARMERDAHLAWVDRAAATIAPALGVDIGELRGRLAEELRDHLEALAATPMDAFDE